MGRWMKERVNNIVSLCQQPFLCPPPLPPSLPHPFFKSVIYFWNRKWEQDRGNFQEMSPITRKITQMLVLHCTKPVLPFAGWIPIECQAVNSCKHIKENEYGVWGQGIKPCILSCLSVTIPPPHPPGITQIVFLILVWSFMSWGLVFCTTLPQKGSL